MMEGQKRKISESLKRAYSLGKRIALKGIPRSEETKRKISQSQMGIPKHSEEFKRKLRERNKGNKFGLGKRHLVSLETKEKISKALLGNVPWNKGVKGIQPWMNLTGLNKKDDKSWNKGRKEIRSDVLRKNSLAHKGIKQTIETRLKRSISMMGKNSKGGITVENQKIRTGIEIRLWREAVFARDNWTDQARNERGGKLHAHHIQNFADFPELRTSIENGITLSEKAHTEFHKKYGKKNNTREQLEEFLSVPYPQMV